MVLRNLFVNQKPRKMKNVIIKFLAVCCIVFIFSCQEDEFAGADLAPEKITHAERTCSMHEHTQQLLENPEYKAKHLAKLKLLNSMVSDRSVNCTTPTIIPVAVHFQGVNNPDASCLRNLSQNQVDILNDDIRGLNADISNWINNASNSFPGVSNGDACLKFCIATKNHPNGYGLVEGEPAVTINTTNGDFDSNWSGYLNIFVQSGTGVLGYAPLGGSGNGDGVVIEATAFGSGSGCGSVSPQAPYNLGRTTTHEVGHYLLLDHIWGGNGGCNNDDNVADTPVSTEPYYDCPSIGQSSCNSTDMHMNYMDYTNDACMYMITEGQATRMFNYVQSSLQNLVNNAANVCDEDGSGGGGGSGPTCDDGIQNGQETGIDCGGPECAPCDSAGTCDDGIQNGQETGVDCGGPDCAPCQTDGECTAPQSSSVDILSNTSAFVDWEDVPGAIKYRIAYRIVGTMFWKKRTTAISERTLTDLVSGAQYEYKLRTRCTDGWTSWSPKKTFIADTEVNTGCDQNEITFQLVLDYYGSETSWELVDESNSVVASGGPYQDGNEGQLIQETFCLEDGCYSLYVDDAYGDGICCDYGDGFFQILDSHGDVIAYSDGYFGYFDVLDFCAFEGNLRKEGERKDSKSASIAKKPYSSNK